MTRRPFLLVIVASAAMLVAACGGAPPSDTPTPSPTVSPVATSSVPAITPSPSIATAAPAGESGGPIAEAVVARLAAEPFVAHVEQLAEMTGTMNGAEMSVTAGMSGDMSGDDFAFVLEVGVPGQETTVEFRVIGDSFYVKEPDGTWATGPRATVGETLDGLTANLRVVKDADELRYVGPETMDGRELHHLTAARPIPYTPSTGGTGEYRELDLWAEADGTPVRIVGTFTATDASGLEGEGTTTFVFSNFGGPIDIEVPPLAPASS
jgi:hypothetical protein